MDNEKSVMKEFLLAYKSFPCLWDKDHKQYNSKDSRIEAYKVLLETLKPLHPEATILDIRKKIENIRTSWRNVHKKVLLAKKNGTKYTPSLWYYDILTFIDDISDFCQYKDQNLSITDEDESSNRSTPVIKKRRHSTSFVTIDNLDNQLPEDNTYQNSYDFSMKTEFKDPIYDLQDQSKISECQSFGTTIGIQMQSLDPTQKNIAQKLISDIIFDARLHRLTVDSKINNNHKSK